MLDVRIGRTDLRSGSSAGVCGARVECPPAPTRTPPGLEQSLIALSTDEGGLALSPGGNTGEPQPRIGGHDYYLQQLYSNEAGGCRQRRALPPSVTKLSLSSGPLAGGTKVKLTGLNVQNPTVTSVDFGTAPAKSFKVTSLTSLTAVAPAGTAAGPVDITVTTSAGTSAKVAADRFTYG